MKWIKNIFKFHYYREFPVSNEQDHEVSEIQQTFKEINFSFREGFPERISMRLKHQLEKNPEEIYYKNLSLLLPRITGFSIAALIVMVLILFTLHGSISPDKLMGTDKIDETNFITYLILE